MYIHIKPSFFSSLHPFVDKSWPSSGVFSQGLLHCNCCWLSLWLYWHMAILLFQSARRIQCLTSVEPASRRSRNTSLPHFELHSGCVVVGVVVSCWQEIGFHRNWNLWKMYRSSLNSFISPLNDERVALMEQEMQVVWFSYIRGWTYRSIEIKDRENPIKPKEKPPLSCRGIWIGPALDKEQTVLLWWCYRFSEGETEPEGIKLNFCRHRGYANNLFLFAKWGSKSTRTTTWPIVPGPGIITTAKEQLQEAITKWPCLS